MNSNANDEPPEPKDDEAERRFNDTLGRMLSTPPKPHKPAKDPPDEHRTK